MNVFIEDAYGQWDGFMSLKNVKRIAFFGGQLHRHGRLTLPRAQCI